MRTIGLMGHYDEQPTNLDPLHWSNNNVLQLTVHIEPGVVGGGPRPVGCLAGVEAAVLHDGAADVDVGDDLAMERDVLAHHEPEDRNISVKAGNIISIVCAGY